MRVLIATPARSSVTAAFYESVVATLDALAERGVERSVKTLDHADIVYARNCLASWFVHETTFTHLLFIDADMAFRPQAILRLLEADKPLVGCACPMRQFDSKAANRALLRVAETDRVLDVRRALSMSYSYNVWLGNHPPAKYGLKRVDAVGAAILAARREVFQRMLDRGVAKAREKPLPAPPFNMPSVYTFFDPIYVTASDYLSEDFSFCQKWRVGLGGEVWALVDERIAHLGIHPYQGRYADALSDEQIEKDDDDDGDGDEP